MITKNNKCQGIIYSLSRFRIQEIMFVLVKKYIYKNFLYASVASAIVIILTIIIELFNVDLRLARFFYSGGYWPGIDTFPWDFIYTYAAVPGFIMAGGGLVVLLAGYVRRPLALYRNQALFYVLLLALGPGLVVNVILKDNLGRARPREVIEFGGKYHYSQAWQRGDTGKNSSFPSGHSSSAFYLFAPWFVCRNRKKILALSFLGGGIAYGSLVGTARMLQGGHFLTDVIWAGLLVYLCGEALAWLLKLENSS